MTASWFETRLPTILSNYELPDIHNADEFGLFFQALPSKSLHLKDEKCIGGKFSKVRLTGLAAANANGEKLPMFIIGKSKSPRCFKNLKQLPCRYRGQKKSWMDSDLFEEWVRELDRKFEQQNRKVVLIIDNCPAHDSSYSANGSRSDSLFKSKIPLKTHQTDNQGYQFQQRYS